MSKSQTHLSNNKTNSNSLLQLLLQSFTNFLKCIPSSSPQTNNFNTIQNTSTTITSMPSESKFTITDRKKTVQSSVKQLHFGGWDEKKAAAKEIKRLAGEGHSTKKLLAELGVITSLVLMLVESTDDHLRCLAIDALIELAKGTFRNKALIVEAGLVAKLPNIIIATQEEEQEEDSSTLVKLKLATLLQSISSLTKTHISITPQTILPFLTTILTTPTNLDPNLKLKCLTTLYNLSTKLETLNLVSSSVPLVHALLTLSLHDQSELALAILANLVLSSRGKKAIEDDPMVPQALIDIIAWHDKPMGQELVMYILMVLANGSSAQRMKMRGLGIVPLLLEVALLGSSALAQKRALKMLEWFKDESRVVNMGVHSGPQEDRFSDPAGTSSSSPEECRRAVRRLVRQSLDQNMKMMTRRGNGSQGCTSLVKSLVVNRSSKSLPY
ncbi:Armadillo-like helical-containing protein [Dioscorea alata]|uniref:Armadillo-like helical-containing protein n=1 Tax=Dioscorea alata TaxID=55571 RepID=A0ACB7WD40_DIOAL|nr:Armadillo-like helical-containing protein [Dioscorea alata]